MAPMTFIRTSVSMPGMATGPWTDEENDLIVADYFAMLAADLAGRPYTKADHNRRLRTRLDRSRPSIEFKHRNISAVMKGLGETWLTGYLPAFNVQMSLAEAVARWLHRHPQFQSPAPCVNQPADIPQTAQLAIELPPTLRNLPPPDELDQMQVIARKFDVAARAERNEALEGQTRLIEVKTTNGWERTPFHITRNELAVAENRPTEWCLLRLWNFAREPRAFELRPPLDAHVSLIATSFEARFH